MTNKRSPSTIKRWQYSSTKGGLEKTIHLNSSFPLPRPKANQHLVQMIAVALNPVDYKPAEVPYVGRLLASRPATPGLDFAGRIVQPANGSSLKAGQLVFGVAGTSPFAGGGLSEYALTETISTLPLPDGVDPVDAATIGVAGLSAYQPIAPRVKSGDKVFINGGSGGTGVFGIQIAKALGCQVTTCCSTPNVELCRKLGADRVVDYKQQNLVQALETGGEKFNLIVDNVGADTDLYWRCHHYTTPDAVYVMIAGLPTLSHFASVLAMKFWPGFIGGGKRAYTGFFAQANTDHLRQIGTWMQEGKVKAVIDSRFSFADVPQAFERLKTGRARGKIVVDIASSAA